jgi:hypothetical protein
VTQAGGPAVIVFSFQWDQPFITSTTYANLTDPTGTSQPRGATGDLDMRSIDATGSTSAWQVACRLQRRWPSGEP